MASDRPQKREKARALSLLKILIGLTQARLGGAKPSR